MFFNKDSIKKKIGQIFKTPYLKFRNKNKITIFVFHEVNDNPSDYVKENNLNLTIDEFKKIVSLIENNYNLISPKIIDNKNNIDNSALITFDDGYLGVFNNALAYLEEKKIHSLHFLNMAPIIEKKANISSTIQYLEKFDNNFQKFIKKENIKKPCYLSISPQIFTKFLNEFGQLSKNNLNNILKFQGDLVDQDKLTYWDKSNYVHYANHLFDHWNTITLDGSNLESQYLQNFKYLKEYNSFINLFAFTNGQPDTCFNIENFNNLKKINPNFIFAASSGQNKISNKILLDRLGVSSIDIDEKIFFYKLLRSFFNFKIKKYQND